MPSPVNNSAARLLQLILRANQAVQKFQQTQSTYPSVIQVWTDVFNTSNQIDAFEPMSQVFKLPAQVKKDVLRAKLPGTTLWFLEAVENTISRIDITQPWNDTNGALTGPTLNGLEVVADLLNSTAPEIIIDEEVIEEWRVKLDKLLNEVLASSLDEDLSEFLAQQVRSMQSAVMMYQVTGVTGLASGISTVVGSMIVEKNRWEQFKEHPLTRNILKVALDVFIATTVSWSSHALAPSEANDPDANAIVANSVTFYEQNFYLSAPKDLANDISELEEKE